MARAAVGDSAWLTVDPWEITRRRVLDYLSVLDHVREILDDAFPDENIRLIMLCDGNELPKLSTGALQVRREKGGEREPGKGREERRGDLCGDHLC